MSKKNHHLLNLIFWFFLSFSLFQCPRQKVSQTEVTCAIFYMNQTGGTCAGVCTCNHRHQMEKTGISV